MYGDDDAAFDPLDDFYPPDSAPGPLEAASEKRWRIFQNWYDRCECLGISHDAAGFISLTVATEAAREAAQEEMSSRMREAMMPQISRYEVPGEVIEQMMGRAVQEVEERLQEKHRPWWHRWFRK